MVKAQEIITQIEKAAPKFLKEDYDNVGMMVGNSESDVERVLLALDCTKDVINEAVLKKCNMIITHHPLFFRKPKSIVSGDMTGDKVIKLIKNDISLYSCHTNLDSAKDGINTRIVEMLGFKNAKIMDSCKRKGYEDCGIGRIAELEEPLKLDDVIRKVKSTLNITHMRVARGKDIIKKVAVINGSGQDYFNMAMNFGADCIITGDTTYHYVSDYKEMGISIIDAGHFGTEYEVFLNTLGFLSDKFRDVEFIKSESSKDPYEFV